MNVESENYVASLLEIAANNDIDNFQKCVDREPSNIDEIGQWYGRQKASNQMVLQHRTPLMVAATYGSIDVLKLILSFPEVDVNRSCGPDHTTALHCAASSGSVNAVDIVHLLLSAGANPNQTDANGVLPLHAIVVPPNFQSIRCSLQMMFRTKSSLQEKREYHVDPFKPDIKNGVYSTDEFRMFSFKIRPCTRTQSHDWTECPFLHSGENARRRDPRKYHYSCIPCPDFRKGSCRRGDECEYAHGVFESWLHPAQYRTRLCKDGTKCGRRVCFFAHKEDERRPLYVSTGSAIPSPRSCTKAVDFAAAMNILSHSPLSVPTPFAPPFSPSTNNDISDKGWGTRRNVPVLNLSVCNRLQSSLNARTIPRQGSSLFLDIDSKPRSFSCELSDPSPESIGANLLNRSACSLTMAPSNLDELFSAESSSPRYSDHALAATFSSPVRKSAFFNRFQQKPGLVSPIETNFLSRNADHSLFQAPLAVQSPRRMFPRGVEPISPMSAQRPLLAQHGNHELGSNAVAAVTSMDKTLAKWCSLNGTVHWETSSDVFRKIEQTSSFEVLKNGEEPDFSWIQSLVKESPQEMKRKSTRRVLGVPATASSSRGRLNPESAY